MHRAVVLATALALASGAQAQVPAQRPGDADRGAALAQAWCAGCHVVGLRGTDVAPPLAEIALRPGRTADYLWAWLADPHPVMPQLNLSRQEIADLIAHLQRLGDD